MINQDTPLWQLTVREFRSLTQESTHKNPVETQEKQKNLVYGIAGLAKALNCSSPTAQKIKNSGDVPFSQAGRKLIFDVDAVLSSLAKKKGVSKI